MGDIDYNLEEGVSKFPLGYTGLHYLHRDTSQESQYFTKSSLLDIPTYITSTPTTSQFKHPFHFNIVLCVGGSKGKSVLYSS